MPLSVLIFSNFIYFLVVLQKKKKKNSRIANLVALRKKKISQMQNFFILFVTEIHFKQAKIKELTNQIKSRIDELRL